jgi:hypothetical protein
MKLNNLATSVIWEAKIKYTPAPPDFLWRVSDYITQHNLQNYAKLEGDTLHIWHYAIQLIYDQNKMLRSQHYNALMILYKELNKFKQKSYKKLTKLTPEEINDLQGLVLFVSMPDDKGRQVASDRFSRMDPQSATRIYKFVVTDPNIADLPRNLVTLLYLLHREQHLQYRGFDIEGDDDKVLGDLRSLNSQTKRLEMVNAALRFIQHEDVKGHNPTTQPRPDPKNYAITNSGLNIFNKMVLKENPSWWWARTALLEAVWLQNNSKVAQHVKSIDPTLQYLRGQLAVLAGLRPDVAKQIIEWCLLNEITNKEATLVRDTVNMILQAQPPVPMAFLKGNKETLKRYHDQLAEQQKQSTELVQFHNDVLKIKELGNIKVVYIDDSYKLWKEGKKMHHCVGSYVQQAASGRNSIYQIFYNDRHIGTLSLIPKYETGEPIVNARNMMIEQAYGPSNKRFSGDILREIRALVKHNQPTEQPVEPELQTQTQPEPQVAPAPEQPQVQQPPMPQAESFLYRLNLILA